MRGIKKLRPKRDWKPGVTKVVDDDAKRRIVIGGCDIAIILLFRMFRPVVIVDSTCVHSCLVYELISTVPLIGTSQDLLVIDWFVGSLNWMSLMSVFFYKFFFTYMLMTFTKVESVSSQCDDPVRNWYAGLATSRFPLSKVSWRIPSFVFFVLRNPELLQLSSFGPSRGF